MSAGNVEDRGNLVGFPFHCGSRGVCGIVPGCDRFHHCFGACHAVAGGKDGAVCTADVFTDHNIAALVFVHFGRCDGALPDRGNHGVAGDIEIRTGLGNGGASAGGVGLAEHHFLAGQSQLAVRILL